MVEYQILEEGVISPKGFRATGVSCGLKTGGSKDMSLIVSDVPCQTAMAFTTNRIQGAHIALDKKRTSENCQAIIIHSGNANCLTGEEGILNAEEILKQTEELLSLNKNSCLLASTGQIGRMLNMTRIHYGLGRITNVINTENSLRNFCAGIASSDSRPKNLAYQFKLGDETVSIGISAKGDSMIKPWFETMHGTLLAFITTDANIDRKLLQQALDKALGYSFNRICIDNDLSPNDSVFLLANGLAQDKMITDENDERFAVFCEVLKLLLIDMSKLLIRHGLGVTKLINLSVKNANNKKEAELIARTIAESYQVKSAFHGQKSAWAKILNTIANTKVEFNLQKISISLNKHILFDNGVPNNSTIAAAHGDLGAIECFLEIDMGIGSEEFFLYTCDLTHDYLKTNSVLSD